MFNAIFLSVGQPSKFFNFHYPISAYEFILTNIRDMRSPINMIVFIQQIYTGNQTLRSIIKILIIKFIQLKQNFRSLIVRCLQYSLKIVIKNYIKVYKKINIFAKLSIKMSTKLQKLVEDFNNLCRQNTQQNPNIPKYLKSKIAKLQQIRSSQTQEKINWKQQLIESYTNLKKCDSIKQKIIVSTEQIMTQYKKVSKLKEYEMQQINNQLTILKSTLQQQKQYMQKQQKDHQRLIKEQKTQQNKLLQRLEQKQFQIRQLYDKINQYEEELSEIKSAQYKNMIQTIKQEQILNEQTQNLFKQNSLLKFQLKQENLLKIQLNKHIKVLNEEIETWQIRYQNLKGYLQKRRRKFHEINYKYNNQQDSTINNNKSQKPTSSTRDLTSTNIRHLQLNEQTLNLIEYKDDFSFKDSIEYDNDQDHDNETAIINNNLNSFLDLDSVNDLIYNKTLSQEDSPDRCFLERDILNLTDRDRSTHSRNYNIDLTKHMIRSKKRYIADKENISDNTLELNEFQQYPQDNNVRASFFGSKIFNNVKQLTSNCSIQKYAPSPRLFGTQQRNSLLTKHRRIKSSFCGKSIQEFMQCQNIQSQNNNHHHNHNNNTKQKHLIVNSQKFQQSIYQYEQQNGLNNLANQSTIIDCNHVNYITIDQELISSHKPKGNNKMLSSIQTLNPTANNANNSIAFQKHPHHYHDNNNLIPATMINSVQLLPQLGQGSSTNQHNNNNPCKSTTKTSPVDIYYTFFSLTAQCVKLNSSNFNKIISIYFPLEQQYKNVLQKTIPINKWYNYIDDQLKTALKYSS